MITSSDEEYKSTKRIKQGKARLAEPFGELAAWISDRWHVNVLNVIYDRRNNLHPPRLQVILEHKSEAQVFHEGGNFDRKKQEEIASKFTQINSLHTQRGYDVDGLFVVFSAFAPLAREEADSKISKSDIDALKKRIGNPELWEISRFFGYVTFLFFTDAQAKEYAANGKQTEFAQMYFEILKPHDEFDYLNQGDFTVALDSKQNFDENYESNWYYYYK
ncbi:MAG: hypothetical protein ACJ8C4_01185 [Gemmataceae bacterium]